MRLKNRVPSLRVATILRIVCFSLTVVALLTGFFWVYQQEAINSIDDKLALAFREERKSQRQYVDELFEAQDYEMAAVKAEKYLSAMQHIGLRDKTYSTKRKLLLRFVQSKARLGPTAAAEALPYAEFWTQSDERDITALRAYILILQAMSGQDKELQDAIKLLHDRFPGEPVSTHRMK